MSLEVFHWKTQVFLKLDPLNEMVKNLVDKKGVCDTLGSLRFEDFFSTSKFEDFKLKFQNAEFKKSKIDYNKTLKLFSKFSRDFH